MKNRPVPSAMPEASDAIRIDFEEGEPPALVFNEGAAPGALVSWAWGQLTALNTLLSAMASAGSRQATEVDLAGAVRCVLVPVINALEYAERRASDLRNESMSRRLRRGKKGHR